MCPSYTSVEVIDTLARARACGSDGRKGGGVAGEGAIGAIDDRDMGGGVIGDVAMGGGVIGEGGAVAGG